ncbi:glycosyltransferase [Thermodesulfovibrio aggregans]|uniref:Glycosyltransferase n=1 Tax=Thermodesulfovibrio aggregans TaxID=86166 RepID=A0A0U9HV45_9BACT|nr:glycosyltransferase family 2 protein [Thermodesulfovibrio aggregans]GAQ94287.1 glycosyltransferase [Thermodesulfovibrio aggregans]
MKIPVSVALITKNEESNIRDALESVKDFEEIVVVDSFSNDKTVQICREYTDKIFQFEWQGFARQKQLAIDKTTLEWVLVLDADERITESLKTEIMDKIKEDKDGYFIPRKNFFLGKWIKHSGWWPDYTLRLFKKSKGKMQQREVHEKILVEGKVGYLKEPMLHYSYHSIEDFIRKMNKYASLSAELIVKCHPSKFRVVFKMLFSPLFTFFKMYILRSGFLDGLRGFILAVLYSFYSFLKYARAWEKLWK